ncbi:MAG: NADPH:quinone oxidoreductase family protein [Acidobacteriota bacterium]
MRGLLCKEFGPFDDLTLETLDAPTPGAGEVAIEVRAAGLNFPDLLIVAGKYQVRPPLPFVPGGECAGVVAAVGDGVEHVAVGDRVIAMGQVGAFAETMVVPAGGVIPMPESLSFEAAAGVAITYGTSYHALKQRARLAADETLLVLGAAGGVGLAAVELGKAMGATVIAAASTSAKLDAAREAGADRTIDYSTEDLKKQTKALTDGRGADVIVDPVGGAYSEQAFRAIAWDGRHLVIGFAAGDIPRLPLNLTLLKGANVCGVFWGTWTERDPAASVENFAELGQMFADGRLRPRITTFPLAEYRDAFATLAERRAIGKVVLTLGEPAS